jgi:hypothetical protein
MFEVVAPEIHTMNKSARERERAEGVKGKPMTPKFRVRRRGAASAASVEDGSRRAVSIKIGLEKIKLSQERE